MFHPFRRKKHRMNEEKPDTPAEATPPEPAPEAAPEAPADAPDDGQAPSTPPEAESPATDDAANPDGQAPSCPPEPDEAARLRDRLLRLQADFDNYRKRQVRERAEWIAQANADLLEDLLPVLDQADTAVAAAEKDASEAAKPWIEGYGMLRRTFLAAVAKHGLKPLESPVGKPLDTARAEALSVLCTGRAEPGSVLFETRRGYELNGRVLRPAQVIVEQEAEPSAEPTASPDGQAPSCPSPDGQAPSCPNPDAQAPSCPSPDGQAPSCPTEEA